MLRRFSMTYFSLAYAVRRLCSFLFTALSDIKDTVTVIFQLQSQTADTLKRYQNQSSNFSVSYWSSLQIQILHLATIYFPTLIHPNPDSYSCSVKLSVLCHTRTHHWDIRISPIIHLLTISLSYFHAHTDKPLHSMVLALSLPSQQHCIADPMWWWGQYNASFSEHVIVRSPHWQIRPQRAAVDDYASACCCDLDLWPFEPKT